MPHLTIGDSEDITAMEAAASAISSRLPIVADIRHLWVMQGATTAGSWNLVEEVALGTTR